MISRAEIKEAASAWGLRQDIVEKDYVLGWLLVGLDTHPNIGTQWVFKGGTCLKKCYLETYRFSEDLDFTPTADASLDPATIAHWMGEVLEGVGRTTGVEFPPDLVEVRARTNPRGGITLRGKVGYRGPLRSPTAPKIRLDLTGDEVVVRPPVLRPIIHPYSDRLDPPAQIHCYPMEELVAEKVRAMSERGRPRDLYDIVRLFRHEASRLDSGVVREALAQKCARRGVPFPTYEQWATSPSRSELASSWESMLGHQLPALPPLESMWPELEAFFGWLEGEAAAPLPPIETAEPIDAAWRQPDRMSLPSEWGVVAPVETIRFAGANRLRIRVSYDPPEGLPGVREVEPYSFRRSQAGHLLFFGRNVARPRISAYRVDRILDVKISTQPFVPRWRVEF